MEKRKSKPPTYKKIEQLYAFVTAQGPDREGVPAIRVGDTLFPLMGADVDRVESLMSRAQQIADAHNIAINVYVWKGPRELYKTIEPRKPPTTS